MKYIFLSILLIAVLIACQPNKREAGEAFPVDFKGIGTEPFWSVTISKQDKVIDFDKAEGGLTRYPYATPLREGDVTTFKTKNDKGSIELRIKKEKCSDGMSDEVFDYSLHIAENGRDFKGCARLVKPSAK